MRPYLRKLDGTIICRADGQAVTNHAAHQAQWHSLSPKPSLDGMSSDSLRIETWTPPATRSIALDIQAQVGTYEIRA